MLSDNGPDSVVIGRCSLKSLMPWFVWGLGCLFYFYECLLQVSPSVMSVELMRDFSMSSQALGVLSGIYFYAYSPMQLPGGVLMDHYGPRRLISLATLICAGSTILFGLTDSFFMACAARLMIGFGSAFAAVGAMKFAANWFSSERFALLTGMMVTIGMLGAIGGEAPLALLVDTFGWRESMIIMGLIGLVLAVLIFFVTKDAPDAETKHTHVNTEEGHILRNLWALLSNHQLWLIAIYGGLMYMSTPVFCGLWGVPFLMHKLGLSKVMAASYISLVFVGWAIASPLWGEFSNRCGKRKPSLYAGSIGALICSLFFIFAPIESGFLMQVFLFLFGIFSAGFLPAFAVAKELCSKRYVATGLGFMNMMNMVGIALIQPFIGFLLDRMWAGEMVGQVRVYPLQAYHIALGILPLGILISLLILPKIKETYCKSMDD